MTVCGPSRVASKGKIVHVTLAGAGSKPRIPVFWFTVRVCVGFLLPGRVAIAAWGSKACVAFTKANSGRAGNRKERRVWASPLSPRLERNALTWAFPKNSWLFICGQVTHGRLPIKGRDSPVAQQTQGIEKSLVLLPVEHPP
jgi:hypothetical protein